MWLEILASVLGGLLLANGVEWAMHKYVLHGLGKRRGTFWSFHWHEHHRNARRYDFHDPCYQRFALGWHAQGKEAWALLAASAALVPLLWLAPYLVITLWYCAANYYYCHRRSHEQPEWAKRKLRWHWDHHMGPNPNANWCVTKPWFDWLMGTREYSQAQTDKPQGQSLPASAAE